VVIPIDPGPREQEELLGFLRALIENPALGEDVGRRAREHAARCHNLEQETERLASFLAQVNAGKVGVLSALAAEAGEEEGLAGYLMEELRWGARDLGLPGWGGGWRELVDGLLGTGR
jgi:hypothetical protein